VVRRLLASSTLLALLMVAGSAPAQGPPDPPARPSFDLNDGHLVLPSPLAFEAGRAELTPASSAAVEHVAAFLAAKEQISLLRIEGHVAGETAEAQALSEQRALAVTRALVAKGVDCRRLIPVGFGGFKPVAPGDSAEGRAANTRIEVVMAALRGRAIGGMPVDGGGRVAGDPCAH